MAVTLSTEHIQELQEAKYLLENLSLTAKISGAIGSPLEKAIRVLPESTRERIVQVTTKSLDTALYAAIHTLSKDVNAERSPRNLGHKISVALTGAAGGAFGIAALALELPVSTTLMLRSIADIAQSQGENLTERDAQLACVEVFALGGPQAYDDAVETGYFGVRSALAKAVSDAAKHVTRFGLANSGAPVLNKFIHSVALRFSIPVSEKVAAQAIPIIGAAGGALINTAFIQHFQSIAKGHFIVRRLERVYGPTVIREAYASLPRQSEKPMSGESTNPASHQSSNNNSDKSPNIRQDLTNDTNPEEKTLK
ncbi:hypothetical protein TDB9533_00463 [Thalassocella blandensis]|nr:hypothetical protein TDB9533_00463 [Thalassocella blandensis]